MVDAPTEPKRRRPKLPPGRLLLLWTLVLGVLVLASVVLVLGAIAPGLGLSQQLVLSIEATAVIAGLLAATLLPFVLDPIRQALYPTDATPPPPTPKICFTIPPLPARLVNRPAQSDQIRDLLVTKRPEAGRRSAAIVGMGGAGKTVLAIVAARDDDVANAYPDRVWITAGQCPGLPELQTRVAHLLGKTDAAYTKVEDGRDDLQRLLSERACLLVVDDVWDKDTLDALDCVGESGALLFTTRDLSIAHVRVEDAWCVEVSELEVEQALALLARWVSTAGHPLMPDQLPPIADQVCVEMGNLALGVALSGGMIQAEGSTPDAWDRVLDALRRADLGAIALRYPPDQYPHSNLLAAVELSIDALPEDKKQHFCELGIFAGRGMVPPGAVAALWNTPPNQTAQLLGEFVGRSLVQRGDQGSIILHDLLYDVARARLAAAHGGPAAAHRKLVQGYRSQPTDDRWSQGPNDGYFYENIAYHLAEAGLCDQLDRLLLDYEWLSSKLRVAGVIGLLADFGFAPRSTATEAVRSALKLSAPIVATDPAALAGQLIGRLLNSGEPEIRNLRASILAFAPRPWLCPLTRALTAPGGPLEQVFDGLTNQVTAVAFSPTGERIVSGGSDGKVRVWSLARSSVERTLEGFGVFNEVRWVAFSPDGERIVSGDSHGNARIWSLASGGLERTLEGHTDFVNAVAMSPDGERIVSGDSHGNLRVWSLASGGLERTLEGHADRVNAVAISPDGERVASGSDDHTVRVWSLASGGLKRTLEGHANRVHAVAFSPDGERIVSGGSNGNLRVWSLASGGLERTLEGHADRVHAVAFSPDGERIVSGGSNGNLRVWSLASGKLERTLRGHTESVNAVAFSPDGQRIVSGSDDHTVRVWTLVRDALEGDLEADIDMVIAVAVSPDGERIVSGSSDGKVQFWNLASGRLERTLEGPAGPVKSVATSPDGQLAVSCGRDANVRIWSLANGNLELTLEGFDMRVLTVAFSPDGKRIVSGDDDPTVRVWSLASGKLERAFRRHTGAVNAVAFCPDGERVVSGSDDHSVRVWSLSSGNLERTLAMPQTRSLASGKLGRILGGTDISGPVRAVATSPDGERIVSGDSFGNLRVWNLAAGNLERTLDGHTESVNAVAFSRAGERIVSGSDDRTVRVWDAATGSQVAYWAADPGVRVRACCPVPPDGALIVYADSARGIHVLRLLEDECGRKDEVGSCH